jgi:CRISP-associated protein Cas1
MQLILNQKGASLAVRNGRFWIRTAEQEHFVAAHQIKSICLHPATRLTHEAIMTALEHQIEVMFIDAKGFPVGRIWSNRFGSISTIRKNQIAFASSPKATEWVRQLLVRKADNHLTVLKLLVALAPDSEPMAQRAAEHIAKYQRKIKFTAFEDNQEAYASMRGYEGQMGRAYFEYISQMLPERYRFARRSQHPAHDMFNCLLNYAYGMLYGMVESALIKAGIDPFLGIMHRDEYNRPVLTYDVIEVYRYWADYVVCHLCWQEVVYADFFEENNGTFWLNHAGKRILIHTFNDYLSEVVTMNQLSRSRQTHIELEAQQLATTLKTFVPKA